MCRHLAWLGEPRTLHDLIVEPPHGLYTQAWAPRRQRYGTVNADGFGAGWYVPSRPEPVRYRRAQPIWADASFASLAPTIASGCVLAAVRSATVGYAGDESCAAPFTHDRYLFSHNGALAKPGLARAALQNAITWVPDAQAGVDSALLFGLATSYWMAGADLAGGLAEMARNAGPVADGRLTSIATDGTALAGVTWDEPLYVRTTAAGTTLAAEPDDDAAGWRQVPDRHVVTVTASGVTISALE